MATQLALTAETSVNVAWYHVVAGGPMALNGLKIRCAQCNLRLESVEKFWGHVDVTIGQTMRTYKKR